MRCGQKESAALMLATVKKARILFTIWNLNIYLPESAKSPVVWAGMNRVVKLLIVDHQLKTSHTIVSLPIVA
jgi:hypothetical protein